MDLMQQLNISAEKKIIVDFADWPVTTATQRLEPTVFWHRDNYCCLLGLDMENGILGSGDSPHDAVLDWEQMLHDRLAASRPDDEVILHVKKVLNLNCG